MRVSEGLHVCMYSGLVPCIGLGVLFGSCEFE